MTQNIVIIGDTHFGARNNSMTWLKHQVDGFKEIIEYVDWSMTEFDQTIVIHVGDLFDSRSSINPLIYKSVSDLMTLMNKTLNERWCQGKEHNGYMYIIGGNHDYYYQWESKNNYSSTLMLPQLNNINYINTNWIDLGDLILIPWFLFHNKETLKCILNEAPKDPIIFTHTDPFHMDPDIKNMIAGIRLVTGHIHQPTDMWKESGLLVTGASYPIDFTDTNTSRGFWTMSRHCWYKIYGKTVTGVEYGDIDLNFHPITSSIHFHTLTECALSNWKCFGIKPDDYVEIQIRASRVDEYKDVLKELNDNFNTNVVYISETNNIITEHTEVLNVDTVFKKLLPNKLEGVYERMIDECSNYK